MNSETKKKLIGAFLKRVFPQQYQNTWLQHMENYLCLGQAIEYLYAEGPEFLALDRLDDSKAEFGVFCNILCASLKFSNTIPPVSIEFNQQNLEVRCQTEVRLWTQYPNANYTSRKTMLLPGTHDNELNELKKAAIQVLTTTLKICLPNIELQGKADLGNEIDRHRGLYAKETNEPRKASLKTELGLLKNIHKITRLEIIDIPNESAEPCLYCTVAESVGGVTEKISLMPLTSVKEKLRNIVKKTRLDLNDYIACMADYDVVPQGILKLPKHGYTVEVQREAIALNIARILGFTTTKSTMVQHNGKAALFIPFDTIQLISEFAKGESQKILIPSAFSLEAFSKIGGSYLNHSTIVPVGNQLHADMMLDDFGHFLAFAYLCNDTDFIGGDNQNKGILSGKELYIFDQVVMSDEKMELDTRLGLMPVGAGKYSRHNQGRNKSIVEDSSLAIKLDSIASLLANRDNISVMIHHIILAHQAKRRSIFAEIDQLNSITAVLSSEQETQLERLHEQQDALELLENDAFLIREVLCARMQSIFKHFPSINEQLMSPAVFLANKDLLMQCLLFEKMLNKPVLFADDGRPYKHPWTERHTVSIRAIKVQGELVSLGIDAFEIRQLMFVLNLCGIPPDSCRVVTGNISMPLLELNKVKERKLFPEYGGFNSKTDYLKVCHLAYPEGVYTKEMQAKALHILNEYQSQLAQTQSPKDKITIMKVALHALQKMYAQENNKGFYKHLEIKLQYDVCQNLLKLIPLLCPDSSTIAAHMLQALDAAIKLDRVNDLIQVLFAFACNPLEQNRVVLMNYLCDCIENGVLATDYNLAKMNSNKLEKQSFDTCQHISSAEYNSPRLIMQKMGGEPSVLQQNRDDKTGKQYQTPVIQKKEAVENNTEQRPVLDMFW